MDFDQTLHQTLDFAHALLLTTSTLGLFTSILVNSLRSIAPLVN